MLTLLFILFAGLAIGCAIAMIAQRNPLYSAISLIGVLLSLACLYVMLAAPFIAAVQVIVYAGAIMVLVVFVIMLLNVEEEERRSLRLRHLIPSAIVLAALLFAEAAFIISFVETSRFTPRTSGSDVGLTASIGAGLFTKYLLPFEITSLLLLMAIVGAMTLARRAALLPEGARVIPGAQVLPRHVVDVGAVGDATPVVTDSTAEAAALLGEPEAGRRASRMKDTD
ncbi:MAG TPA: NADH-quinone oxidoreductase subunit J [Pyrinomonadaceae bacterium]|jgi:NADH-quinone oxidoreductase subunit J|nr:NADH-quinone oxidoreductase subunit J [Pyrinomonadaceae bacterium]